MFQVEAGAGSRLCGEECGPDQQKAAIHFCHSRGQLPIKAKCGGINENQIKSRVRRGSFQGCGMNLHF